MTLKLTRDISGLEDILSSLHMSAFPEKQGWKPLDFKELLAISFHHIIINYDIDNRIIGFLIYSLILDEAEIITFCVAPLKQKQGIGNETLAFFLEKMRCQHIQKVFLEVAENNMSALNLYKKFGFLTIGKRSKYYNNQTDALLMEKILCSC